ncbi:hypothetical protein [Sphingobacterium sp.]|uniref:hypothetical protein n=1 Tax=Sphingobacterium sp. TaxID=341027 RepID=UPI0028AB4E72|nr:hypothetical protein [Sphingobacterium sp.]
MEKRSRAFFFLFDFFNRIHLIKSETDRQSVFILLTPQRTNLFSGLCFLPDIWPLKTLQHKIDIAGLDQLAEAAFVTWSKGLYSMGPR